MIRLTREEEGAIAEWAFGRLEDESGEFPDEDNIRFFKKLLRKLGEDV